MQRAGFLLISAKLGPQKMSSEPDVSNVGSPITYNAAVELLLSNQFAQAETRFLKDSMSSTRHALLYAQVAFARSVLSLDPADLEETIDR